MKILANYFRTLVFVLMASTSLLASASTDFCTKDENQKEVWINIYVHGIISIKPHITVSNFVRFLTDDVCDTIYAETVDLMRNDPFFFQNQAVQHIGLRKIDLENQRPGAAAAAMATIFEMVNQTNQTPTRNYYYTYGWSGLLSRSARYNDARTFLFELENEVNSYRAQGIEPKIRIFGYSHGGTIVLKLGMVKQVENLQPSFQIDEAFLLGTPIQFDTDYVIHDPLYKKIYNIFSRGDRVQKLDFFSCGEFFSERIFKPHCDFNVPDKLVQIEIRIIRKKGEACRPYSSYSNCHFLYDGKKCSRNFRNVSPGHTELWFFGWTPMHYRPSFPLYPLPIVAFMPFIINSIKPYERSFRSETPITITIDPRRNSMIITDNLRCCNIYKVPFIGIENLIALQNAALQFKPPESIFNKQTYDEHINQAYDQAIMMLRERKCQEKIDAMANACNNN